VPSQITSVEHHDTVVRANDCSKLRVRSTNDHNFRTDYEYVPHFLPQIRFLLPLLPPPPTISDSNLEALFYRPDPPR